MKAEDPRPRRKLPPASPLAFWGALLAVLLAAGVAHASGFDDAARAGASSMFVFALSWGLATTLTPCVYPMIPITISVFGAKSGVSRGRAMMLATCYVLGIALMFGVLGTVVGMLGKAFGAWLGSPVVVVPIAALFTALALSMFGAFELNLPSALQQRLSRVGGAGFGGAFLMGLVAGIIAAPCTGPPLLGILTFVGSTQNAVLGFALTFTYGVGVGLPFWLVAGFSMSLPKAGAWMESVKSVFGIVLLVAALYFLKNVAPPLARMTDPSALFLAVALGAVALGVLAGAVHLSFHDEAKVKLRKALGVALAVAGLFLTTNWVLTPRGEVKLAWLHGEAEALADAKAAGRPMFIDFYADWCTPCKAMDVAVFAKPEVASELARFTLLKFNTSEDTPAVEATVKRYEAGALPSFRIVSPDGRILARADGEKHPGEFLKFLASARP